MATKTTTKTQMEILTSWCEVRLEAERSIAHDKVISEEAREEAIKLFQAVGVKEVPIDSEGIRYVDTTAQTIDEDAIEAYVKRYAPEQYDKVFPQVRTFRADVLKALVQTGDIGATALTHITTHPGSPRLSRYKVK